MTISTRTVHYQHQGTDFLGHFASPLPQARTKPAVMVVHTWAGRDDFACQQAEQLAGWGYAAMAIDLYGQARTGQTPEECSSLMNDLIQDRGLLQARLNVALEALREQPESDADRIAAIGFCFGGLGVLDLARSGADIRGVASFHGIFSAPEALPAPPIKAKILVLHGFEDPMAPPESALALGQELTRRGADWQLHFYSNTMHAFTNPNAHNPEAGTVYNRLSNDRSFEVLRDFLTEVLK